MRELKFRVWDNELKTFPFIGFDILGETTVFDVVKQYSLEKKTNNTLNIEQYTGLKDKNGVEIYEGDTVKHTVESNHLDKTDWCIIVGVVVMIEGLWCIGSLKYPLYAFTNEVIGNIHQTSN